MTTRRSFLAGVLATGLTPRIGWADAGAPAFLSAGRDSDGRDHLFGLDRFGHPLFRISVPDRGHAAAAHPLRPEAVAFARRPGKYAVVMDCFTGSVKARLNAPAGRHFYGHGTFSRSGDLLFTTENDFEAGEGRIGIWNARTRYERIGEIASGGVGPHDIRLMPDGETLVVANGGIETHPDSGRAKLNLPDMRPNLSYIDFDGSFIELVELDPALHLNSIRHLDIREDGLLAFAMQWQGEVPDAPPVLGLHLMGQMPRLVTGTEAETRSMRGYGGSVTFWDHGLRVAVSSPRGGMIQMSDVSSATVSGARSVADVCGLGTLNARLVASSGTGAVFDATNEIEQLSQSSIAWDNHLVTVDYSQSR